jgi:predicted PurR-regulated permease PerM
LTILLWGAAIGIIVWLLSHIVQVVLLLSISAIIAFAIAPITVVLERFLPRFLAILVVYVLALARQMPYPYAEAKALSTYGDLLVANGQPKRARNQYNAALAILRPLGEVPYTERIEQALATQPLRILPCCAAAAARPTPGTRARHTSLRCSRGSRQMLATS